MFTHATSRREGNTNPLMDSRTVRQMSPWSRLEWPRDDGETDVDVRLTRRRFIYTIAGLCWDVLLGGQSSGSTLDRRCVHTWTHKLVLRHRFCNSLIYTSSEAYIVDFRHDFAHLWTSITRHRVCNWLEWLSCIVITDHILHTSMTDNNKKHKNIQPTLGT